jgi:hypothetical protein
MSSIYSDLQDLSKKESYKVNVCERSYTASAENMRKENTIQLGKGSIRQHIAVGCIR